MLVIIFFSSLSQQPLKVKELFIVYLSLALKNHPKTNNPPQRWFVMRDNIGIVQGQWIRDRCTCKEVLALLAVACIPQQIMGESNDTLAIHFLDTSGGDIKFETAIPGLISSREIQVAQIILFAWMTAYMLFRFFQVIFSCLQPFSILPIFLQPW